MAASGNGKKWVSSNGKKAIAGNGSKSAYSGNGKKQDTPVKQILNG
jgi:hypothetical protein